MGALETEEILRQEAEAIHKAVGLSDKTGQVLNHALNTLNSTALCLSGGGIRSAAFALGVIQALAVHPRSLSPGEAKDDALAVADADKSLLSTFHYLSTVSGGGYIGSWLSAWRARSDFKTVWNNLVRRPSGPNIEPKTISWLRSYSNYLTPRPGLLSADSWAAAALYIGNLTVNWLIILPFICAAILLLKFIVWLLIWGTLLEEYPSHNLLFAASGVLFLFKALAFTVRNRPSCQSGNADPSKSEPKGVSQEAFLRGNLFYSIVSAIALTQFLGSNFAGGHLVARCTDAGFVVETCSDSTINLGTYLNQPTVSIAGVIVVGAFVGLLIYAIAWLWGDPRKPGRDFIMWIVSGLVYGALVGFGFYLYLLVPDEEIVPLKQLNWFILNPVMYLILGVPWILSSQFIAEVIFAALINHREGAGADWEWLARSGGWKLIAALGWILAMLLTFPNFHESELMQHLSWVAVIGSISALIVALLGISSLSPGPHRAKGVLEKTTNFVLTVAAPLFAAALIFILSVGLDTVIFGASGEELLKTAFPSLETMEDYATWTWQVGLVFLAFIISITAGFYASRLININRFSLHAVYRDRLIRAFLGASRERNPDRFTDMDADDNPRVHTLWSDKNEGGWRPFHVINITLNIVSAKRLAWQERKAASFTVSPLHCGTGSRSKVVKDQTGSTMDVPIGAYRYSREYGGFGKDKASSGILLGTAMAISGAAASPNMGYHSSPAITFLMSMLNVRLGWWLGNPGSEGEKTYMHDGPIDAIVPLLQETFGLTTDDKEYIYLSDGGHFDNLGLYEMIRRRCRYVVVIDAGCDPEFAFEDLGNALRKITIDLGVSIHFNKLGALKKRPVVGSEVLTDGDYHAIGQIDYKSADGGGENGIILYVKAGYHGTEGVEIQSYAVANPDFPHQSTADQSFGESQFESYRALGFEIMGRVLNTALRADDCPPNPKISDILCVLQKENHTSTADPTSSLRDLSESQGVRTSIT